MKLPSFKYHPDPLATGSVIKSARSCECCEKQNGFIYTGPVYSEEELQDAICPWCIADGSAAEKSDATFTDEAGVGEDTLLSSEITEEVARRTPGFSGWQQERWLACCEDAAAFLGPMGRKELDQLGPAASAAVRDECGLDGNEWTDYFKALNRDNGPTAYLFRCLHCQSFKAYSDCA